MYLFNRHKQIRIYSRFKISKCFLFFMIVVHSSEASSEVTNLNKIFAPKSDETYKTVQFKQLSNFKFDQKKMPKLKAMAIFI